MPAPRIAPVEPPFSPSVRDVLDRIMPEGVPPLALFTTLARNERVFHRVMAGGLLDKGSLTLRQREIVIDRTCARCGCEYEWGVHVAFFGERVRLTAEQGRAIVHGDAADPAWSDDERLLIRLADALHDGARLPDPLWSALSRAFSAEQILEMIALAGFYHMISFLASGMELALEPYAARFPVVQRGASATLSRS